MRGNANLGADSPSIVVGLSDLISWEKGNMVDVISHLTFCSSCHHVRSTIATPSHWLLTVGSLRSRRRRGRGRIRTGFDWPIPAALVPVLLQSLSGTLFLTVFFAGFWVLPYEGLVMSHWSVGLSYSAFCCVYSCLFIFCLVFYIMHSVLWSTLYGYGGGVE